MQSGAVSVTAQLKQSRRQVAELLRSGKAENARIRVESVMREEQMLQAYEGTRRLSHLIHSCHALTFDPTCNVGKLGMA